MVLFSTPPPTLVLPGLAGFPVSSKHAQQGSVDGGQVTGGAWCGTLEMGRTAVLCALIAL